MRAPHGDAGRRKALANANEQRLDFDIAERLARDPVVRIAYGFFAVVFVWLFRGRLPSASSPR
jgi:hypothetical protein